MALAQGDLEEIGRYVREHIPEWMGEEGRVSLIREFDLRERIVRVEEELKHQRELMEQGFALMEKRFDQIDKRFELMEKRFEQIDKRFEQTEKRFDQVDKHFEQVEKHFEQMEKRFEQVDKHFELMDKRFEQTDKHFESMDRRFETLNQRMDHFMVWSFGLTISATGILLAAIKYLH